MITCGLSFWGIGFTFIYNFYAALLRAIGDAVTPLWFLAVSVVLNIGLDLFFILQLDWGIKGAAIATVAAQGVSALGIMGYAYVKYPELRLHRNDLHFDRHCLKEITSFSALTCVQQSVMNLGILMVQGLVNSFGTVVMAAFAAAIKMTRSPICRYRNSEMPFPPLLPRTSEREKRNGSAKE